MAEVWTHRKEKAYSKNTHSEENWPAVPFLLAQCELSCVLNLAILNQKCGLPETKGQAGLLTSEVLGRDKEKDWGQQTLARSHPQCKAFFIGDTHATSKEHSNQLDGRDFWPLKGHEAIRQAGSGESNMSTEGSGVGRWGGYMQWLSQTWLYMLSMHWPGQIREVRTHLQNQERPSIELLRNFNAKKVLSFSRPPIPYCHRAPSLEFKSVREGRKSPLLPRILSQDMSQKSFSHKFNL